MKTFHGIPHSDYFKEGKFQILYHFMYPLLKLLSYRLCNVGDLGSVPGLGRFPGEQKGENSSFLAWRIPWTIQSMGSRKVRHD